MHILVDVGVAVLKKTIESAVPSSVSGCVLDIRERKRQEEKEKRKDPCHRSQYSADSDLVECQETREQELINSGPVNNASGI